MGRALLALVAVVAVSCGGHDGTRSPRALAEKMPGAWELARIDAVAPSELNIRTHAIVLEHDGTWRFASTAAGPWTSATLTGSGTWVPASDGVRFTRGSDTTLVAVSVDGDVLRFEPDPVLSGPGGSPPVPTEYHRVPVAHDPSVQPPGHAPAAAR